MLTFHDRTALSSSASSRNLTAGLVNRIILALSFACGPFHEPLPISEGPSDVPSRLTAR